MIYWSIEKWFITYIETCAEGPSWFGNCDLSWDFHHDNWSKEQRDSWDGSVRKRFFNWQNVILDWMSNSEMFYFFNWRFVNWRNVIFDLLINWEMIYFVNWRIDNWENVISDSLLNWEMIKFVNWRNVNWQNVPCATCKVAVVRFRKDEDDSRDDPTRQSCGDPDQSWSLAFFRARLSRRLGMASSKRQRKTYCCCEGKNASRMGMFLFIVFFPITKKKELSFVLL